MAKKDRNGLLGPKNDLFGLSPSPSPAVSRQTLTASLSLDKNQQFIIRYFFQNFLDVITP